MLPRSELLKTSRQSRPYSSLKATKLAQIARGTSVSRVDAEKDNVHVTSVLYIADKALPHRSKMGELESGNLRVHTV